MAIVFPLASPVQFGLASVRWERADNTARARNPFTFRTVTQVFPGQIWRGRLAVVPQDPAEGRGLAGWLTALSRGEGTFLLGDPGAAAPLGSAKDDPGLPVADGVQTAGATSLALRGLPASASGYLKTGDYLQLGSGATARLYMALADVDSDGSGDATAEIWPDLRADTVDGEAVVVSGAEGVFMLPGNAAGWEERDSLIYDGVELEVEEVVT